MAVNDIVIVIDHPVKVIEVGTPGPPGTPGSLLSNVTALMWAETLPANLPVGGLWLDTSTTPKLPPSIASIPQQGFVSTAGITVPITIGDPHDVLACTLSVTSGDSAAIPTTGITFGGIGANRTMTIPPLASPGQSLLTVTVTNSDGMTSATSFLAVGALTSFTVTASAGANGSISPTGAVTVLQGQNKTFTAIPSTGYLVSQLVVDGVPMVGINSYTFNNVQANHTISAVFALNTAPTISAIADLSTNYQTPTGAIAFTIGDAETDASLLTVTKASSNQTLVPDANIVIGGSGANRTVTVTPANGQSGTATITITVSDGTLTASETFVLTVAFLFDDLFDNSSLDTTNFGTSVAGGGSVTETTRLNVTSTADAAAATCYYKNFNIANNYTYLTVFKYLTSGDIGNPFAIMQSSIAPACATVATNVSKRRIYAEINANSIGVYYVKPDGTVSNTATVTTTANTTYKVKTIISGNTVQMQVLSSTDVVLCDSGVLTIGTDIKNDATTYWMQIGADMFTDAHHMTLQFSEFKVTG